jgi:EmrB/QacA subfamily drug resistance transporter
VTTETGSAGAAGPVGAGEALAPPSPPAAFDPELRKLSLVVVVGAVMTILDTTIVNVAITTLGRQFDTSLSTIQWVLTGYTLALSMTIPLTTWAIARFGTRQVWLGSLSLFAAGSVLCGLAWSVGSLIAFRVLQGVGAGLIMPVGQTMLARAAGPARMGRVMAVIAVPAMLAPVLGPVVGGVIVDNIDWRWLFYVNAPISAVAIALAVRLLPADTERDRRARIDVLGLALLSPGLAALVYGLSQAANGTGPGSARVLLGVGAGVVLVGAFALRALWRPVSSLVDLRVFRSRPFSAAVAALFTYSAGAFGLIVLLPLYLQIVRGYSPTDAGLLTAPWGLGAIVTMPIAGRLTDRGGPRGVALAGVVTALAGAFAYTGIQADTSRWLIAGGIFVVGLGHGMLIPSLTGGMYRGLARTDVPTATTASNVLIRIGGSLGIAVLAVVLQSAIRERVPGASGSLADVAAVPRTPALLASVTDAFAHSFWWVVAIVALSLVPVLLMPGRRPVPAAEPAA